MYKKINWRYAFGELLIVIIGITIAFSLNNWAQNRNNKQLAKAYLQELKKDVEKDLQSLEESHATLQKNLSAIDAIIPHFFSQLPGRDTIPKSFFIKIHEYVDFFPHKATYESMLHSGDLKLITDFQLKNSIVEHYNNYNKLFEALERHENFAKTYSADFFMKETDHLLLFRNQQTELIDLPYMRNLCFSSKGILQIQIEAFEEAIRACEELLWKLGIDSNDK